MRAAELHPFKRASKYHTTKRMLALCRNPILPVCTLLGCPSLEMNVHLVTESIDPCLTWIIRRSRGKIP
jgi:hypothetical protein